MKKLLFLFAVFSLHLEAAETKPLQISFNSGYRQDHIQFRFIQSGPPNNLTLSEDYSAISLWQNEGRLTTVLKGVLLEAGAGYSAFGKGMGKQKIYNLPFTWETPTFHLRADTQAIDAQGKIGYVYPLATGMGWKFIGIPYVGFIYQYEQIHQKQFMPEPFSSTHLFVSGFYEFSSLKPSHGQRMKWYGPFVGVGFEAPLWKWTLEGIYGYYWLRLHQKTNQLFRIRLFNSAFALTSDTLNLSKSRISDGGNHGHSAFMRLAYNSSPHLHFALLGWFYYFFTRPLTAQVRTITDTFTSPQGTSETFETRKFKQHWMSYTIAGEMGIDF